MGSESFDLIKPVPAINTATIAMMPTAISPQAVAEALVGPALTNLYVSTKITHRLTLAMMPIASATSG